MAPRHDAQHGNPPLHEIPQSCDTGDDQLTMLRRRQQPTRFDVALSKYGFLLALTAILFLGAVIGTLVLAAGG
jgi:hypothetical protein